MEAGWAEDTEGMVEDEDAEQARVAASRRAASGPERHVERGGQADAVIHAVPAERRRLERPHARGIVGEDPDAVDGEEPRVAARHDEVAELAGHPLHAERMGRVLIYSYGPCASPAMIRNDQELFTGAAA